MFSLIIQYFDWGKVGLQTKLLYIKINPSEKAEVGYVHSTLTKSDLVNKTIAFCGDNCNTVFGRVARASKNNMFAKLQ